MDTKKRASIVREELMSLYGNPPIPLAHRDAYTLLVAVLLSAQCTDKRVNLVTPALFALASTPRKGPGRMWKRSGKSCGPAASRKGRRPPS